MLVVRVGRGDGRGGMIGGKQGKGIRVGNVNFDSALVSFWVV